MQRPSASTLIPVLTILSIIAGGLFFLFKPQNDIVRQPTSPPVSQRSQSPQAEIPVQPTTAITPEPPSGTYRRAPIATTSIDPCLTAIKQLDGFFLSLDDQDYIKEYQFPNGSKDFIANILNKALANPPAINGSLAKNSAHLYRTVGGQSLLILAKILTNEPDQLEAVFANFYHWSLTMGGQCQNRTYSIRPQLNQLYQYALFFLNSDDGKNYINRRATMTGLLTRYYALLIIKEAKDHHIDSFNTDISLDIATLITDIESTDLLANKTEYLKKLYALRDN